MEGSLNKLNISQTSSECPVFVPEVAVLFECLMLLHPAKNRTGHDNYIHNC